MSFVFPAGRWYHDAIGHYYELAFRCTAIFPTVYPYLLDKAFGDLIQLNAWVVKPASTTQVSVVLHAARKVCEDGTMITECFVAYGAMKVITALVLAVMAWNPVPLVRRCCDDSAAVARTYRRTCILCGVIRYRNRPVIIP